MENSKNEFSYHRDKFTDALKDYLDYEREYYKYFSQFITELLNGVVTHEATKVISFDEQRKLETIREKLEEKRNKLREAEEKMKPFFNNKK
jgi:flagellar biosynthesis chaperone FliJ